MPNDKPAIRCPCCLQADTFAFENHYTNTTHACNDCQTEWNESARVTPQFDEAQEYKAFLNWVEGEYDKRLQPWDAWCARAKLGGRG